YGLLMSGALAVTQLFVLAKRPCKRLKTIPAIAPLAKTTANIRSFLSSLAFILTAPRRSDYPPATPVDRIHRMGSRDGRSLLDKRGELRALVGHEHRDQFGGLGVAGIGRDQMHGAGRLEEGLPDPKGLDRTARQLRADFALGDIGGDRTGMPVRRREPAGAIEHAHDRHALARHVRQRMRRDRLDDVLCRTRRIAAHAWRLDHRRD